MHKEHYQAKIEKWVLALHHQQKQDLDG